jgi:hypothetical protein
VKTDEINLKWFTELAPTAFKILPDFKTNANPAPRETSMISTFAF